MACQTTGIKISGQQCPEWTEKTQDFWWEDNNLYYKSVIETGTNSDISFRIAAARARVSLGEQIRIRVKNHFYQITQHSHFGIVKDIEDIFYGKVDGLVLTGTQIFDSCDQEINIKNKEHVISKKRYYLLLKIPREAYELAIDWAFEETSLEIPHQSKKINQIKEVFTDNVAI